MKPCFIYVTRNGLLEPLGQSQIWGYIRGLARDYEIIIFSREKPQDWSQTGFVSQQLEECRDLGIDWRPRLFTSRPKLVAPLLDMQQSYQEVSAAAIEKKAVAVHARSYLPAAVARRVSLVTGVPYIFDMRALWADELLSANRISRIGPTLKFLRWMERSNLNDSTVIVSLTNAAVGYLRSEYPTELKNKDIRVIPTCADLSRFGPSASQDLDRSVHGCIGTILSGWFKTHWLRVWFAEVAKREPSARFEILTLDDAYQVRRVIDPLGKIGERLTIAARAPREMPDALKLHASSAFFYAGGQVSELGRSPTRMGEVLGTGLPIIANEGVGDVAEIIKENRVGVVLRGTNADCVSAAYDEFTNLQRDPSLAARCRETAENLFSLEQGTQAYRSIYGKLVNERA